MDNCSDEQPDDINGEEEAEISQEKPLNNLKAMNGVMSESSCGGEKLQNGGVERGMSEGEREGEGGEGGGDLSSINAMMSAVMSAAGTINGDAESGVTSPNSSTGPSPSPSPSKSLSSAMRAPPGRTARRPQIHPNNEETKDEGSHFICPLCDKNCGTQHALTMHIRQHNTDTGATDHSCAICGKCLSSASSLDRHMLVHSGERPYKCNVCGQTFTTNGNMHRHMKIHEKDPASGLLPVSPPSPTKRRRPSVKRRMEEESDEPPSKKAVDESLVDESCVSELLPCPICFTTCSSRLELDEHMDAHPDTALRCDFCCLSFRTHRGLLRHNAGVHKLLPQDPSGRPFIQSNPSIPTGFNDLAFIDFSCKKFAHIAQVWCETNLRRCISKFHRFVCDCCDKAFPLRSALELHKTTSHSDKPKPSSDTRERGEREGNDPGNLENDLEGLKEKEEEEEPSEQDSFMEGLGLQHISKVHHGPTDDEIHQAHLDSIRVIHVEPPTSSLPQEPASGYPASSYLSGGLSGLTLGLGMGGLAALSIPLLEASGTGSGFSQRDALSLLSLQPFQSGYLLQPDGGAATGSSASSGSKPGEASGSGGRLMELADIQQILKVASAANNQMGQMGLPTLAKAPGFNGGQGSQKSMPPLKPKPPLTPRSSLTATTPPPLQSSQQASLGCISPSLPPNPNPNNPFKHLSPNLPPNLTPNLNNLFKTPNSSSSASSSSSMGNADGECMSDPNTPLSDSPPTANHEEAGRKAGSKGGSNGNNAGSAKGSFPCRFCDQVFSFSGVLQAHMRFHLGILPHQCNICDYVAPDKATLIRHLRTHSGERPYVCRVCHYPFTVKANCERHLRKKHGKTSRKEIEKNIKYVTSTTTASIASATTTTTTSSTTTTNNNTTTTTNQNTPDTETTTTGQAETTCRFCGDDLKTYRALQIHLRTHNGCQRKPFECRRCGAAFLAKRNCIHHLLKQHPEVQEREIEEHIATLMPAAQTAPVASATTTGPGRAANTLSMLNGLSAAQIHSVKLEELLYTSDPDQPLDFSSKSRGGSACVSASASPGVKTENVSPSYDVTSTLTDQPIDLSVPSKRQRREIKTEQISSSILEQQQLVLAANKEEKTVSVNALQKTPLHAHPQLGCYQLPPGSTGPNTRAQRLKPLLPKPTGASSTPPSSSAAAQKELPPLASIAQIIHSVSGAPDLLKRDASAAVNVCVLEGKTHTDSTADTHTPTVAMETQSDDTSEGTSRYVSRKRSRKKPSALSIKEKSVLSSAVDLESSGEFASVEKMLATTDANKFSTYLQTAELAAKRDIEVPSEDKEGAVSEVKPVPPQSKGKKNAYSNSVQKMTCPFCPRVFPWASSLQRHMLTHTGQKPFPCPKCDAFFSTKSNCERHLLRKHGVTHRTLRRNGLSKREGDEGSHDSNESQSETDQAGNESQDFTHDSGRAPASVSPSPSDNEEEGSTSPNHKDSHGNSLSDGDEPETENPEETEQQGEPESRAAHTNNTKVESADDDDCHSNKSLDLNFGKKLIDFKLSNTSSGPGQEETPPSTQSTPPSPSPSPSPSKPPTAAPIATTESLENEKNTPSPSPSKTSNSSSATNIPAVKQQPDYKHVCRVCKKSFRYATTLARHERAHLSEETPTTVTAADKMAAAAEENPPAKEEEEATKESNTQEAATASKSTTEEEVVEDKETEGDDGAVSDAAPGSEGAQDSGESDEEEEEKEKDDRSDEETTEPKNHDGGRVDKRKKICNVCGKRFWSLQDLTRHTRSHTGERPYQCQTCERTFTLKHSLVRHQRIHLKPRGANDANDANDDIASGEEGDTPTSTCPPSENESEDEEIKGLPTTPEEIPEKPADSEPTPTSTTEEEEEEVEEKPCAEDKPEPSTEAATLQQPLADTTASPQATDTETTTSEVADSNTSKDPPPSSSPTPPEGLVHGLQETHADTPPLEQILPIGEPPLVGVE